MATIMMLMAGVLAGLANLCFRRSIDAGGSPRAYLVVQLGCSGLVGILLNPMRTQMYEWSSPTLWLGIIGGLLLGILMWGIGKALEKGPPGLTFAVLNSSTVMPALIMAIMFGVAWGHGYNGWHAVGSALVIGGLFWAGWEAKIPSHKMQWASFAGLAFVLHVVLLVFLQWRALLFQEGAGSSRLLPVRLFEGRSEWFMPVMFATATLLHFLIYLRHERRRPNLKEVGYGLLGGIVNGGAIFFLIFAPQRARPWENAMMFPLFAVTIIIISNLWGQALYREQVNWRANCVCLAGITLGTVDWRALL